MEFQAYAHPITIMPGTMLHEIVGAQQLTVNSIHHQAIRELVSAFRASAQSDDGVIEAIEFAEPSRIKSFFLGVQWHLEWLPKDPASHCLYARFVEVCEVTCTADVK